MSRINRSIAALLAASCLLTPVIAVAAGELLQQPQLRLAAEKPAEIAAVAIAVTGPDDVELAALYYYADQKQDDRVQAEIARLQVKYPGFEAPRNLYLPLAQRSVDEQSLWDLYQKDDFAGIEAETVRLRAAHAGWVPSEDFTGKLERRRQRVLMTAAAAAGNWAGVVAAGTGLDPETETEIDLLWTMIDAYRATGMSEPLTAVYKGILFRKDDRRLADDLLATTLQKATADFSADEVRSVIASLWPQPGMVAALLPVSNDLLRRQVGDFNADAARAEPLPQDDIARLAALAASGQASADFALLGWYYLKLKQPAEAAKNFAPALERDDKVDNAKGLYLSLIQQGRDEQAYQVAATHLAALGGDPEFLMNALSARFSKPELGAMDAQGVAAYSKTIVETQSADHAEILAWYAYNSKQFEASEAWFAKSWGWQQKPESLKGLALSYMRQGRKKDLAALRDQFGDRYPQVWEEIAVAKPPRGSKGIAVAKPAGDGQVNYVTSLKAKRYDDCIRDLKRQEARGGLSADAQLIRGWCLMGLNRPSEAKAAFAAALQGKGSTRQDAAYGSALASLRGQLTDEAEAVLAAYPLGAEKDREVRGEIYWQRARSAFDRKQYEAALAAMNARLQLMPEPTDISVLRAWSHQRLGRKAEANAIFQRLSMHLGDSKIMNGLNTTQATR